MSALTRDEILNSRELDRVRLSTPEWGAGDGHVFVRVLKGFELDKAQELLEARRSNNQSEAQTQARLVVLCVCDADGNALFTEADLDALLQGPGPPIFRCAMKALDLNALTDAALERLEGNLPGAQPSDSGTG